MYCMQWRRKEGGGGGGGLEGLEPPNISEVGAQAPQSLGNSLHGTLNYSHDFLTQVIKKVLLKTSVMDQSPPPIFTSLICLCIVVRLRWKAH